MVYLLCLRGDATICISSFTPRASARGIVPDCSPATSSSASGQAAYANNTPRSDSTGRGGASLSLISFVLRFCVSAPRLFSSSPRTPLNSSMRATVTSIRREVGHRPTWALCRRGLAPSKQMTILNFQINRVNVG